MSGRPEERRRRADTPPVPFSSVKRTAYTEREEVKGINGDRPPKPQPDVNINIPL